MLDTATRPFPCQTQKQTKIKKKKKKKKKKDNEIAFSKKKYHLVRTTFSASVQDIYPV